MSEFRLVVATGSVAGLAHTRTGRNSQDGLCVHAEEDLLVAVVTDGCSSARGSEVGAQLGARWLAQWVPRLVPYARTDAELLQSVRGGLLEFLGKTAGALYPDREDLAASVEEFFLFTYLCAVLRPERTLVFGQGDGVVSVNGAAQVLDSGPDNAPPYLAYALVPDALESDPGPLEPVLHHAGPTDEIQSLVLATDGAAELISRADEPLRDGRRQGGLEQFEQGPELINDPLLLQHQLDVISRINHRLRDDTTLVVIRRAPPQEE